MYLQRPRDDDRCQRAPALDAEGANSTPHTPVDSKHTTPRPPPQAAAELPTLLYSTWILFYVRIASAADEGRTGARGALTPNETAG